MILIGNVFEDEKIFGIVYVVFGVSVGIGGIVLVLIYIDCVVVELMLMIGGMFVIDVGCFLL